MTEGEHFVFTGPVFEWRGPAPYHFVEVPPEDAEDLKELSVEVTYGWGMIPVLMRLGETRWETSLWPKDGGYYVPLKDFVGRIGEERFHPSDITIDPFTGDYVLISGIEKAIVEITPDGHVVFARKLPPGHDQPESVAITKDSILIIGDEAKQRPAILTLYRWP